MPRMILRSRHRILCGDSTLPDDVSRLLDGQTIDLCFTSPPYNAGDNSLGGNSSMVGSKYLNDGDDKTADEYQRLLFDFTTIVLHHCRQAIVNIQQLAGNKRAVLKWLAEFADQFVDLAIWDKESAPPQMAANILNNQHELLAIFAKEKAPSRALQFAAFHGTISTVYKGGGQRDKEAAALHAATMPIHLPTWVLGTLCPLAQSVYDPFGGSGTTMVAADALGRRAYLMEREPVYCDVAVERYRKTHGGVAVLWHS